MKIAVFSNNPLDYENSNGRTLLKMLGRFKNKDILNIFFNGNVTADNEIKYYYLNETRIIKNQKPFGHFLNKEVSKNQRLSATKRKKTALKCLVRSLLWNKQSVFSEILKTINDFHPNVLLVQCGDSDFLLNICVRVSKKLSIPLISFNSEDYIFKTWDYFKKVQKKNIFFRVFMSRLKKSYNNLYSSSSSFIYLNDALKTIYDKRFGGKDSYVIYNSTDVQNNGKIKRSTDIVYSGNLGVGRADTLIDISKIIYKISNNRTKVYSLCNDDLILSKIKNEPSINYIGPVKYEENLYIICSSRLILLIDSFDDYYARDTINAFSTKIADSLASGTPVFVVSPKNSATYEYFKKYHCGMLCSNLKESERVLKQFFLSKIDLAKIKNAQLNVAKTNHSSIVNSNKFYEIVRRLCE